MYRYFLQIALAFAAIETSNTVSGKERCFLQCDRIRSPGPKLQYNIVQCDYNQVCMQTMNYTTDIAILDNKIRKDSIIFLHRYCAPAQACKERCRMALVKGRPTVIMSCISCMNSTSFGPEGKLVSQVTCYDDSGPVIDPID